MKAKQPKSTFIRSIEALENALNACARNEQIKSVLLLAADKNHPPKNVFDPLLAGFNKPLMGGIFPEIIHQGKKEEEGFLIVPLNFELKTALIHLSGGSNPALLREMADQMAAEPGQKPTIVTFVDTFTPGKNNYIHELYNLFGITVNYLGGGAGSLSFQQFPCILHNSGVYQDAAVIGIFQTNLSIGVAHGWSPISKPMKITEAKENKIFSIDWQPAFEVYKTWVESHSGLKFSDHNFFDLAKSYPLGMVKLDSEMVIRDPFAVENDVLHIVDIVPEGEYVSIMHGNMDSLLAGALLARENATKPPQDGDTEQLFCVDCISRVLYMQEDYSREMAILSEAGPVDGILSIGEIAGTGVSYLEIFNKSIVFAKWKWKT